MNSQEFSPTLDIRSVLTIADGVIFTLVFLLTIAAILYGYKIRKSTEETKSNSLLEYMLMGRQLTLPLFVGSLVATWYGGIFGVTQIAYERGLYNLLTQGIFWYITYLIFAFFMVKRVRKVKAATLPELVEKLFGPRSAKLTTVFVFFDVLPVAYVMSLGLFLHAVFGGSIFLMTCLGVFGILSYSLFGGFRAVIFSDFIQFVVMCIAVLLVLVFSYQTFGGITFLKAHLPESHWSFSGGEKFLNIMVWGFIALSTLVDPCFYQRCFAAKSTKIAKKGVIIATLIWFCFDLCTTFGAMYARAAMPDAPSNQAYLIYAMQLLPPGFRGFFLAGILATILSTIDSYLFIAGTTLSYDAVPKSWRGRISLHHLGVFIVAIVSIVVGQFFNGNIREVCRTLGSYSAGCLLLPLLLGFVFPKKISDQGFVCSSLMGVVAMTVCY